MTVELNLRMINPVDEIAPTISQQLSLQLLLKNQLSAIGAMLGLEPISETESLEAYLTAIENGIDHLKQPVVMVGGRTRADLIGAGYRMEDVDDAVLYDINDYTEQLRYGDFWDKLKRVVTEHYPDLLPVEETENV